MTDSFLELGGRRVLVCAAQGPLLGQEGDANDFLSLAFSTDAELLVVPVSRLDKRFFDLRSGMAGQIVQKCATYRMQLVVLGDVSALVEQSRAFRDFVYEANQGRSLWFVSDEGNLQEKLKAR
jgi:hypothetical protein